ncbi:MAG: hypothetical protein U1E39_07690 [Planctomycetota bacterium]
MERSVPVESRSPAAPGSTSRRGLAGRRGARAVRAGVVAAAAIVVAVGFLVVGGARSADAGAVSKRYRDRNAKFSFRVWDDWDQVPLETEGKSAARWGGGTDSYAVCKYVESGADKRGTLAAELMAYRIGGGTQGMKTGVTTEGDGPKDPIMEEIKKRFGSDEPKTARDLFLKILMGGGYLDEPAPAKPAKGGKAPKGGQAAPPEDDGPGAWEKERERMKALGESLLSEKNAKAVKSKDGVPGKMWVVERVNPLAYWTDKPFYLVFAAFKKDEVEVGLWIVCEGDRRKKIEPGCKQVVSSFIWFDEQADDVESKAVLDGLPISAEKRRAIERGLIGGWDVAVSPLKNYVILYNTKGRRNDFLAKIIGERIEQIRAQVYEVQFPPAQPIKAVCICRICGDAAEYHHYGGPGGSAGYWNSDTEELVFYDASPAKAPDDDTLAVLYHEAFHQYIYYSVGEVAPHSWFNEGHGDYYAGSKYTAKKFEIKPFNWRVSTIQGALAAGPSPCETVTDPQTKQTYDKYDRKKGGYTPLDKFVRMTQGEYYSYPGVSYAQGWSLVYFLREYVPKNPKWAAKWGKILPTYFDTLKAAVNAERPTPKPGPKPGPGGPAMGGDAPTAPGDGPTTPDEPKPPTLPGDDAPGSGDPSPDEPGMGDGPGMGEPGMGDAPSGDEPNPFEGFTMPSSRYRSSADALKKAVDTAFAGVDMAELEAAWRETMRKVK